MGYSSSYRIAGIAIVLCLVAAGLITLFSPVQESGSDGGIREPPGTGTEPKTFPEVISTPVTLNKPSSETNRIRILWYDTISKTYTFRDYDRSDQPSPSTWTDTDLPPPENGTLQRQAAMVRFLTWDGKMERVTGTKYLTDQETITGILNRYTLVVPPVPSLTPVITRTPSPAEPKPDVTPAPGKLIPTKEQPCNQGDGTIRISFGYTSRHNTPVFLEIGEKNQFSPGAPDRGQPTTFMPGIHTDVFIVNIPTNSSNIIWNLMDTTIGAGIVPELRSAFLAEPVAGYAPLTVRFTDESDGDTPENPLTGVWNFGDGTTSELTEVNHRYENPGTYQVTRTVGTTCGRKTSTETISVFEAGFITEQVSGSPGTFRFSDTSTGDPAVRFWDFSDGFTSWEQNPVHTWKKPGKYPVGLRVSGNNGVGSIVKTITVDA
jgi:hypothetical protein